MQSISEMTNSALQGNVLERLSGQIRENPSAIKRGLEHAIPVSLAGLGSYASSERNAEDLLGQLRGGQYPHMSPHEVTDVVGDPAATARMTQSSSGMLGRVFGDRQTAVVDAIAKQSGLTRSGASAVLGLAAPLVLSAVGKETEERHLDARGLSHFLREEGRSVSGSLPESVTGAMGPAAIGAGAIGGTAGGARGMMSEARGAASRATSDTRGAVSDARSTIADKLHRARGSTTEAMPEEHRRRGMGWKLGAIAVAAIAALFLFSRRNATPSMPEGRTAEPPKTTAPQVETPKQPVAPQVAPPSVQPAPGAQAAPQGAQRDQQQGAQQGQQQGAQQQDQQEGAQQAQQQGAQQDQQQAQAPEAQGAQPAAPEGQTGQPAASPTAPSPEEAAGVAAEPLSEDTGADPLTAALTGDETLPKRFVLEDVQFATGATTVASNRVLDDVAGALKQNPGAKIRLDGYADATGDPAQNETLSTGRADAVKDYLVKQGASADAITTSGNASERPVASNDTDQGKAQNRRVELVLTDRAAS